MHPAKKPLLLVFLLLFFISDTTYGKDLMDTTCYIRAIGGKKEKIIIKNDWRYDRIKIVCEKDTLWVLDNKYGSVTVHLLNRNFLKIHYEAPGGSGLHNDKSLLLCVKNGKLFESMNMLSKSLFYGAMNDSEVDLTNLFTINIQDAGSLDSNNFRLNIVMHVMNRGELTPKKYWCNYRRSKVLNFDKKRNIFYNTHKHLSGTYNVYTDETGTTTKMNFTGIFPAIELDKEWGTYYYINGTWYGGGEER